MKSRFAPLLLVLALLGGTAQAQEKVMVYTSMKESLMGKLRDAFKKQQPGLAFDYYSAGAGKVMAKLAAERQAGKLSVDILWHSEVPDFFQLKNEGMFEPYASPEAVAIRSTVTDPDKAFTVARLGTLGIAYNTDNAAKVGRVPKTWADLLDPAFKNKVVIANPSLSGTSFMSCAMLVEKFGWDYFNKLKANGAKIGQGSGQVVDDTASGDFTACIAVDYIALDKIQKGAHLKLVFPPEMLVIPSPIAIMKASPNKPAARKFIDFLLSKEGQAIVAAAGTLPARADVAIDKSLGLVAPEEAIKRAIKLDYPAAIKLKEGFVKQFEKTMR